MRELPEVFREHVGLFGPLAVPMNRSAYWVSAVITVAVVVAAAVVGTRRQRWALAATVAAVPVASVVVSAAVQLLAWYSNARRYAVGTRGPRLFVGAAEWSPPAGWWVWLAVAVAALRAGRAGRVQASVTAPLSAPVTRRANLANTPVV